MVLQVFNTEYNKNSIALTFQSMVDDFYRFVGSAFGKPVLSEKNRDFICVDQFAGEHPHRSNRNLELENGCKDLALELNLL